jgi:hypothetical protein
MYILPSASSTHVSGMILAHNSWAIQPFFPGRVPAATFEAGMSWTGRRSSVDVPTQRQHGSSSISGGGIFRVTSSVEDLAFLFDKVACTSGFRFAGFRFAGEADTSFCTSCDGGRFAFAARSSSTSMTTLNLHQIQVNEFKLYAHLSTTHLHAFAFLPSSIQLSSAKFTLSAQFKPKLNPA